MTKTEYFRKMRAILTKWGHKSQDENARRLAAGIKLNKRAGRDGGKMQKLSKFQLKLKAFRGQPQAIGYQSGALKARLQHRKSIRIFRDANSLSADIDIGDDMRGRLDMFETARSWVPTKNEAYKLSAMSHEMGEEINFGGKTLNRPARPFFGRSKEVDDWAWEEVQKLRKQFFEEKAAEGAKKARKK